MKWYVVVSLCFCAANFVTALALVGLSSYHLYDDDRYVPVKETEDWFQMIIGLIPFAIFTMVVSLFSLWGVIQRNRKWSASVVALNASCVVGSVVFVVLFSQLAHASPISGEELLNRTQTAIEKLVEQNDDIALWIPSWLDRIQNESSGCCGIETYKDWEIFWPSTPSLIPRSCCMSPSNDTTICPKDLARIPYPGTPAKFIKVDHGCIEEINLGVKRHILETYKFMWILTVFLIGGEIAYCLVYFFRYYCSGKYGEENNLKINMMSAGDMGDDSFGGMTKITVTQLGSSTEAIPGEIRIDPDTGNPVISFNVVTYDNNTSKSQSGSSSITSGLLRTSSNSNPLPELTNYRVNSQNNFENSYQNTITPPAFQYNGLNTSNTTANPTIADPVSTVINPQQQRRAVFLVQDSTDFSSIEDIASGVGSNSSFDDFGDLPSKDTARSRGPTVLKEKGAAGVTRKKRF